ncbi:thioredoxin family protein [Carboxylicivirga sp. A043]|uniref:thioredoxin family protein n=1 Tax=Carboxylicivirga litoralis TaxID=2816963 RepID=UPI0021CB9782|nr:thioredoxin domain-containing protein [Carboxylicivirga sp. A043]MCU4154344.1 thioredoxin family protein [Carboxylicivirga sp. A043]
MKTIFSILFSLVVAVACAQSSDGVHFTHDTWKEIKELAKEQNKSIFIDCYTSWCGPCKMLSKNVFPQTAVGELFNAHFINYKVDMENGEGPLLKKQFNVSAYPTLIWVDSNGNELHKSVGAPNADELISIAQQVIDGKGLAALERNYTAQSNNFTVMLNYIEGLSNAYEPQKIQVVLATYFKSVEKTELLKEKNYSLIKNYLEDIYSPAFEWFHKHQTDFKNQYSSEEVDQKLYRTYLSYGHSLVRKDKIDYKGYKQYCKTLKKRKVNNRERIVAYIDESICRAEQNWDAYIQKVNENMKLGYYESTNSFLFYNWAKAIDNSDNAQKQHYQQAAEWMEKAFEVSQWPLVNNIVYLDEKLKILQKVNVDNIDVRELEERISQLKDEVKN